MILHFEPSLDALSLGSDVISSIKILSLLDGLTTGGQPCLSENGLAMEALCVLDCLFGMYFMESPG